MIRGLIHRCTIWSPTGTTTDPYGQATPDGFATTATLLPCRLRGAGDGEPEVLVGSGAVVAIHDRLTDVTTPAGASVDPGPFAVIDIVPVVGRADVAFQRLRLRRITSIDQT